MTKVGEVFEIPLTGNPSTGYRWHLQFDALDIALEDRRFVSVGKRTGSGGVEKFKFRALKVGKTEIVMILKRSWEKGVQEEKTFEVLIKK
jgi:predicted secreted protein